MASKLPPGRVRVTLSFEGAADDVTVRLIEFFKSLPAEEAAQGLRDLQRAMRARQKKALRVVHGGTP